MRARGPDQAAARRPAPARPTRGFWGAAARLAPAPRTPRGRRAATARALRAPLPAAILIDPPAPQAPRRPTPTRPRQARCPTRLYPALGRYGLRPGRGRD